MYLATVSKDRQKEANDMLDEFTAFWTTSIDYENQLAFIQEANALVRHKFRPIPQFQSYMHAYMAYVTSEYATESETWDITPHTASRSSKRTCCSMSVSSKTIFSTKRTT